jgi:2',3'-cyclic-nucleotide 2'-phosphodiesterase (5'-nucleotidase family)
LIQEVQERRVVSLAELDDANWRIVPAEAAARVRQLFGAPPAPAASRPGETILGRVLALGEFRGAVTQRAAALATVLDRAAAECRCDAVRVAPGGMLQGTLAADVGSGRPAVEVLNRIDLSATAVGPRDASWSLDTLRQRVAQSRFAWLAANLVDSATGRRPDWTGAYRIVSSGGLRIGLVGYVSPGAAGAFRAAGIHGLRIQAGRAGLADALGAVKREQVDLTVVLAHAPLACDGAGCTGEAMELARDLGDAGVEVVLGAGDGGGAARVGNVQVVAVKPAAAEVVSIDVVRTAVAARELRVSRTPVDAERIPPDSAVEAVVERAKARADTIGGRIVARIKLPLRRGGPGASPLGDLVADAQRNALRGDVALVSDATLSADLPAGPASYASLVVLLQASRPLVAVTVTGAKLKQVLEAAIDDEDPPVHLSGVVLRYDPGAPAGRRVRRLRLSDGASVKNEKTYTVVVTEALLRQGRFAALHGSPVAPSTTTDVDALALYLRRLPQPVAPPEPGRLERSR